MGNGQRQFVWMGNSCSEEARVHALLRSHSSAWLAWLSALETTVEAHIQHVLGMPPHQQLPTPADRVGCFRLTQTPRDCLVGTLYAL